AATGACFCEPSFGGPQCSECGHGRWGFPNCTGCSCNPAGSDRTAAATPTTAAASVTRATPGGTAPAAPRASRCCVTMATARLGVPALPVQRRRQRSRERLRPADRQVSLPSRVRGANCDSCRIGYRNFPLCEPCACDTRGSKVFPKFPNGLCIQNSPKPCICKPNAVGPRCQRCRPGFLGTSAATIRRAARAATARLRACAASWPTATWRLGAAGCGLRGCSRCPSGSRDLAARRWLGCLPCGCDTAGSLGPNCVAAPDGVGSVCACLNDSVAGRLCDRPASEHFWPGSRTAPNRARDLRSNPIVAGRRPQRRQRDGAAAALRLQRNGVPRLLLPRLRAARQAAACRGARTRDRQPGPGAAAPRHPLPGGRLPARRRQRHRRRLRPACVPVGGRQLASVPVGAPANAGAAPRPPWSCRTPEPHAAAGAGRPDGPPRPGALLIDWLELTPAELLTGQACAAISRRPAEFSRQRLRCLLGVRACPMLDDKFRLSSAEQRFSDGGLGSRPGAERYPPWGRASCCWTSSATGPEATQWSWRVGDNSLEFQLPACPNSSPGGTRQERRRAPRPAGRAGAEGGRHGDPPELLSWAAHLVRPPVCLAAAVWGRAQASQSPCYTIPLSACRRGLLESRIARYRLARHYAGPTGAPSRASLRPGRPPQAAAGQAAPRSRRWPAQPPVLLRLRTGQTAGARRPRAATVSLRFAALGDSAAPLATAAFAMAAPERLRLLPTGCRGSTSLLTAPKTRARPQLLDACQLLRRRGRVMPCDIGEIAAAARESNETSARPPRAAKPCSDWAPRFPPKTDLLADAAGSSECDCPGGLLCSEPDGECICPRNVAGKKCDRCEPGNYGYNVPCRCNSPGTTNGSATCDLVTGQCSCGENIAGQKCSHCKRGHFAFPSCEKCNCTSEGVTEEICSAESGACACKVSCGDTGYTKTWPAHVLEVQGGVLQPGTGESFGLHRLLLQRPANATCTEAAARMVTQLRQLGEPADPVERLTNETVRLYLGRLRLSMRLEFDGAPAAAELDSFLTLWSSFTNQNGSVMSRLQFLNFLAGCAASLGRWPSLATCGPVSDELHLFATARLQDASLELAEVSDASSAAGRARPGRGAAARCRRSSQASPASCRSRLLHRYQRAAADVSQLTIKPCRLQQPLELCDPSAASA
uniref:Laminin EGF-like domain-containing protein n=1 Tax=Macrostomum lignano TaxID=282301 RepID=A0A1I8FFH6_9PLAT